MDEDFMLLIILVFVFGLAIGVNSILTFTEHYELKSVDSLDFVCEQFVGEEATYRQDADSHEFVCVDSNNTIHYYNIEYETYKTI